MGSWAKDYNSSFQSINSHLYLIGHIQDKHQNQPIKLIKSEFILDEKFYNTNIFSTIINWQYC